LPGALAGLVFRTPKNPEFRRFFFLRVLTSSEGDRSWVIAEPDRIEVVEDGLNTLRLFLRSFFPKLSAIAGRSG
jgi:hypothetical protein